MKETHFLWLCVSLSTLYLLLFCLLRSLILQSQSQLPSWDRAPAISPADMRTDAFTARPSRSQSFRDPPLKGERKICLWHRHVLISSFKIVFNASFVSFQRRSHPVWDRKTATRLFVVNTGRSEPRSLIPRPSTAFRCALRPLDALCHC